MDVCVADPSQVKFYDVLAKKDPKKNKYGYWDPT